MDWSDGTLVVAVYAAILATGAFALEVRRWFESGPRLRLTLIAKAEMRGGLARDDNKYLHARVTNRGAMPTTITNFGLQQYRTIFHRLARKPEMSAIIPTPVGYPLPHLLQPGTEWGASAVYDEDLLKWAESGKLFVAIYISHRSQPIQRKVKLPPNVAGE